ADPSGVPRREGEGVVAAHRVTDETRARPAEVVEDSEEVASEVLGRVGRWSRPRALAVTALIQGDDVEALDQRRQDRVEPVGVGRPAVEQEDRWPAGDTPLEPGEPEAADGDRPAPGDHAAEHARIVPGPAQPRGRSQAALRASSAFQSKATPWPGRSGATASPSSSTRGWATKRSSPKPCTSRNDAFGTAARRCTWRS